MTREAPRRALSVRFPLIVLAIIIIIIVVVVVVVVVKLTQSF